MKLIRLIILLITTIVLNLGHAVAHDIVWLENEDGFDPLIANPMVLDYQEYVVVAPSTGEECTVTVVLDPVDSPFFTAEVLAPNPENAVWIEVRLLKVPSDFVNAKITGYWSATGKPDPISCDATNKNFFEVPIVIPPSPAKLKIAQGSDPSTAEISSAGKFVLQAAQSLLGPWFNVAKGTNSTVNADDGVSFFRKAARLGGAVGGMVTDAAGKPHTGLIAGLVGGGVSGAAAADGSFALQKLPYGTNVIAFTKPFTFVDPNTGATRTFTTGLEVEVPVIKASGFLRFKVEVQVFPIPCVCTPWCAIGYGSMNGGNTPVYFSGGVNKAKNIPGFCDQPTVTVTPPSGPAFNIRAGSGKHQNSGPNPSSGTWTVTTTVCGQSKSCSIDVP